jgi:predicted acyl esterase
MRFVSAPSWDELHPEHVTFTSAQTGTTSSATPGPAGAASDPITTATLPLPGAYHGCRIMRPSQADPTVVTYLFDVDADLVLMGGPTVDVAFTTTAPDTQLHARLWDVLPDGSAQGLVDRGTYRSVDAPGSGLHAVFQLTPQGYRFAAGHKLKVEVTANDAPYFQQSNVPAVVQVSGISITLPLLERPSVAQPATTTSAPTSTTTRPQALLPATGTERRPLLWIALGLASIAVLVGVRSRPARGRAP